MSDKITIVFLGSPAISCPFLAKLASDARFEVQTVITQEDKPSGRKKKLTPTPIKELALQLGLPVFQPNRLNKDQQLIAHLRSMQPDFLVVVAYGQIVSQKVLDIPKIKPINVHGSLLPAYRGASPIEQALLNGDRETGLSIMEMVLEMDAGPVYAKLIQPIASDDNNQTLRKKLSEMGSEALPDLLMQIKNQQLHSIPQDISKVTFCQKIDKADGQIDPLTQTVQQIYNRFRAFITWPGIFLKLKEKQLKLTDIVPVSSSTTKVNPGTFHIENDQILLGCREGNIQIKTLQLEGKTIQDAKTFLLGNRHLFD